MKRAALALAFACGLAAGPAAAETVRRAYPPSSADIENPERGFWRFAAEDFATVSKGELASIRADGMTMAYAVARLDAFRAKPLSPALLKRLDAAFARARASGLKLILRFAYNYPQDEHEYKNAKDAPLGVVLGHIEQLAPLLARNADVVAVWQAGFIGAWGEGHTSSNKLTTPKNKAAIRDALLAALPAGRMLQWRYPADVIDWSPTPPPAGALATVGLHNDCFLSSKTDVGTYSDDRKERERQRAYAASLSRATFYGGETCDVGSGSERTACEDVLLEGRAFHLSTLNRDYSRKFIKAWEAGGCLEEVSRRMGHRLVLKEAAAPDLARRGETVDIRLSVANEGWARLYNPRPFRVIATHRASGRSFAIEGAGDVRGVEPEAAAPTEFGFAWEPPADAPSGAYDLAAALPDASPSLAADPAYAVRFANGSGAGFGWAAGTGRYALGLAVEIAD